MGFGGFSWKRAIGLSAAKARLSRRVVDAHHVRLRAARVGSGAGRVYSIGIGCTDRSGNHSSAPVIVTVPHDHH